MGGLNINFLSMKSRYVMFLTVGMLLLVGVGCSSKETTNNLITREQELNTPRLKDKKQETMIPDNVPTNNNLTTQEPEYNTPILQEKEPDFMEKNASYFFVVENKNNNLGNDSGYGILSVRKNCESFGIVLLTKAQPLNLSVYKNKPIVWKQYELRGGEYTLKEIAEDTTATQEIENFKKTCPDPFGRYMGSSVALPGVHLYVESLDQSSTNVLAAVKAINVVEYKPAELTDKNQIKTFFFTVPNNKSLELEAILRKEANDDNVYGAKNLYGGFSEVERAEHGTTNFKIKLIAVSILK